MTIFEILRNLEMYIKSEKFQRLWPGQHSIFKALSEFLKKETCGFLKLPSGVGKTNLAIELANAGKFRKVLFLVPKLVLVDQTDQRFRTYGEDIASIGTFTGTKKDLDGQIIIATYQSIQRLNEFPIDPASFDLVIWDEVHEALTAGRQNIMNFFGKNTIHIGLTASDKFSDVKEVKNLMPLIAEMEIEEAIQMKLLCPVQCWIAQTNIDITQIIMRGREYDIKSQKRTLDVNRRNQAAVDIYSRFLNGQTCLVTCINIRHAQKVAEIFQRAGISSQAVWGATQDNPLSKRELRQRLEDFKTGEIKVMTTVDLIGTGFDNTLLSALINLRITSSVVLATQRGGRVLRQFSEDDKNLLVVRKMITAFGGKVATVVDFLDECHNHAYRPVLFSDILRHAAIFPAPVEIHQGDNYGGGYLWPEGDGVRIRLITDVVQVAKITAEMTNFENLPVANEDGIVFLPIER